MSDHLKRMPGLVGYLADPNNPVCPEGYGAMVIDGEVVCVPSRHKRDVVDVNKARQKKLDEQKRAKEAERKSDYFCGMFDPNCKKTPIKHERDAYSNPNYGSPQKDHRIEKNGGFTDEQIDSFKNWANNRFGLEFPK